MNAFIILNEGDASVFIKDNEFFYNPIEWIILMNKANKALNPLLENVQPLTTTTVIESLPLSLPSPHLQFKASSLNHVDNLDLFSTNNDFQREFQLNRSQTNLTSNSLSSTVSSINSQELNYKTWYGVPNPYHELNALTASKCEHISYRNYSTDHQNSTFTPVIFTPRKTQRFIQKGQRPPDGSSAQEMIDFEYSDQDNDVRTILKLMDKVQEKMTQTYSFGAINSIPSSAVKSFARTSARSSQKPTTPQANRISDRGQLFLTSATSIPSSPLMHSKTPQVNEKRMLQQFILKQQEGLFLPEILNSEKRLAAPNTKLAIKNQLHNIYEFYSDQETLIGFIPTKTSTNFYINKINEQQYVNQNGNNNNTNGFNLTSSISDAALINNENNSKLPDSSPESLSNKKPKKSIIQVSANAPNTSIATNAANKTKEVKFSLKNK